MSPAYAIALQAFRKASATLARRRQHTVAGMPDWLDPQAVNALWLNLAGEGPPALGVALRDDVPLRSLPRAWRLPDAAEALPLLRAHAPRAQAQAGPTLVPANDPGFEGSATALLHDPLGPHSYLLTCGHVAAPKPGCRAGDTVQVSCGDGIYGHAELRNWQPSQLDGAYRTRLDAALLQLDPGLSDALRHEASLLPTAVAGAAPIANQALVLRRRSGEAQGWAKVHWSGPVDVPGLSPGAADYFLEGAIGYRCSQATQGGDSGAAIWDERQALMGMHVAGLAGAGPNDANAVYGPIQPVLDFFHMQVRLRGGVSPAPSVAAGPARQPASVRPGGRSSAALADLDVVACTLWGEARNQGERGMRGVASVIANRARTRYRRKDNAVAVCLDPWQFSCWNANDPNLPQLYRVAAAPDRPYRQALVVAAEVLSGELADITAGARHYYARTIPVPYWARGKTPCAEVGDHLFFNNVA